MITKKQINGKDIKKALGVFRVCQDYHNKNKNGGNFGLSIYVKEEFNHLTDRNLNGQYDKEGIITKLDLSFIRCGIGGFEKLPINNFEELIETLKEIILDNFTTTCKNCGFENKFLAEKGDHCDNCQEEII